MGSHFARRATGACSQEPRAKIFANGEIPVHTYKVCFFVLPLCFVNRHSICSSETPHPSLKIFAQARRCTEYKNFGQAFLKACGFQRQSLWAPVATGEIPMRSQNAGKVNLNGLQFKEGNPRRGFPFFVSLHSVLGCSV